MCFGLMFWMNSGYAIISVILLILVYIGIGATNDDKKNLSAIFQGVIFQTSRQLQVFLQKAEKNKNLIFLRTSQSLLSIRFEKAISQLSLEKIIPIFF